jgi:hypothetical protein
VNITNIAKHCSFPLSGFFQSSCIQNSKNLFSEIWKQFALDSFDKMRIDIRINNDVREKYSDVPESFILNVEKSASVKDLFDKVCDVQH